MIWYLDSILNIFSSSLNYFAKNAFYKDTPVDVSAVVL